MIIQGPIDCDEWAETVAVLLSDRVLPPSIRWEDPHEDPGLFADVQPEVSNPRRDHGPATHFKYSKASRISSKLRDRVRFALCHTDPSRWSVLYQLAWRIHIEGDRALLSDAADPDVRNLEILIKQVRFDAHKAKAFVRFRKSAGEDGSARYVAWHKPAHRILHLVAPFFAQRFGSMRWTIFTPSESADWDGERLTLGPGVPSDPFAESDSMEDLWKTYYASIFNPARVKVGAMLREMPKRYWSTMPETSLIDEMLSEAEPRVRQMLKQSAKANQSAEAFLPPEGHRSLPQLASAAKYCEGCPLHESATQAVFGEGPANAHLMLVGEQPGDQEDIAGRPFVGPAGELLDKALIEAGMNRDDIYITNAVKHFHHEQRGKQRWHKRPTVAHMRACEPWLRAEIEHIAPRVLVTLGVTAGQAINGPQFTLREHRGRALWNGRWSLTTIAIEHPAAILRTPDSEAQNRKYAEFVEGLRFAKARLTVE